WAIENATPVDFAIIKVAAAVPGPQMIRAAVPTNSAASLREKVTSAIDPPTTPGVRGRGPHLLRARNGISFGCAERCFAEVSAPALGVSIARRVRNRRVIHRATPRGR